MKAFQIWLASILLLAASASWARPAVLVDVKDELKEVDQAIADLRTYESNFWAIGIHGDTLQPDVFLKFFADRELSFKYFIRSQQGLAVGEQGAYQENIATLQAYHQGVLQDEIQAVQKAIDGLLMYQQNFWAVGLHGDTLQPDAFLSFFGERGLSFQIFVVSEFVQVGLMSAYEQNIQVLKEYMTELESHQMHK